MSRTYVLVNTNQGFCIRGPYPHTIMEWHGQKKVLVHHETAYVIQGISREDVAVRACASMEACKDMEHPEECVADLKTALKELLEDVVKGQAHVARISQARAALKNAGVA